MARIIKEANSLASLGLYLEALEVQDAVPLSDRDSPAVAAARLGVYQVLRIWAMGEEAADHIGPLDMNQYREAAGKFHLEHAIALSATGDNVSAWMAVNSMMAVWPEGWCLARDCDALAALW